VQHSHTILEKLIQKCFLLQIAPQSRTPLSLKYVKHLVVLACDGGQVDEIDTDSLSTIDITGNGDACDEADPCGSCVAQLIGQPMGCKVQSYFSVGDLNTGVYELFCN